MIDAYTFTTPNGFKLLIALEELGLEYRTKWINIAKGEQKSPEYLAVNPNGKIPALVDDEGPEGPIAVFESGAILTYLAEKTGKLMPSSGPGRYAVMEWVYFAIGGPGPMMGQYQHFIKFAKEQVPYAIERYKAETERLLEVLDKRLADNRYLAGDFSIADIINFTWPNAARTRMGVDFTPYPNLVRWLDELAARPAFVKALAMKPPVAAGT